MESFGGYMFLGHASGEVISELHRWVREKLFQRFVAQCTHGEQPTQWLDGERVRAPDGANTAAPSLL